MADIKTHLRELSVAVAIGCLKAGIQVPSLLTPDSFMEIARRTVSGDISSASNIRTLPRFDKEHTDIISHSIALGRLIHEKFDVSPQDEVVWLGNDTQSGSPVDITVGTHRFSLKENSFILENMGLYKLLSLITTQQYRRGLHVFEEFAPAEYEAWFAYTWRKLIEAGAWSKTFDRYHSSFHIDGSHVILNFNNKITKRVPTEIITTNQFNQHTNGITREKVFSKWISECLQVDTEYLRLKKLCAEVAGQNLCSHIHNNLSQDGLGRLMQLRDFEYYYAKSTNHELTLLKVPSIQQFSDEIRIADVRADIPESQLNIITVIQNILTEKTVSIKNECRFSHGQLNGTPEAKMYYKKGVDLSVIYTAI